MAIFVIMQVYFFPAVVFSEFQLEFNFISIGFIQLVNRKLLFFHLQVPPFITSTVFSVW